MKVTVEIDLAGSFEAAELLGVDRTRPSKLRMVGTTFGPARSRFLSRWPTLSPGPVFLRSDVEKLIPFVEERRRTKDSIERRARARLRKAV